MIFNSSEDSFDSDSIFSASPFPQNASDYSTALNTKNYFEASSVSPVIDDAIIDTQPQNETSFNPPFNLGFYTVGDTGKVNFDYLLNGGAYQGELGIFSLAGLGKYEIGTEAFIEETARRSLSNSQSGYVVISEQTEAARYTTEDADYTSGKYEGIKTFEMNPGNQFGVMLVPDGTMQEVLNNPGIDGSKQPIFSLAPMNPQKAFHIGQLKDMTGGGSIWAMEDLNSGSGTDKDFNDFVFYMEGAVGNAPSFDTLVNPVRDWRSDDVGKNLLGDESIGSNRSTEDSNPVIEQPSEEIQNQEQVDSEPGISSEPKTEVGKIGSGENSSSEQNEPEFSVGKPFNSVWEEFKDTLGNPISDVQNYSNEVTSQLFENGSIVKSNNGTFPLYGVIREKYLDADGLNGWLGTPTSGEVGLGDGKSKQEFENGYIVWDGNAAKVYQYENDTSPRVEDPANNQTTPIELVDPTSEDWIDANNPDSNRDKYWSKRDQGAVFDSWSFLRSLPKVEDVAQEWENYLRNFFNSWNLPLADKHMEHFLNQGDSSDDLGTPINDMPVDEMLKYVPGFKEEYDARIDLVKDQLTQYSEQLKREGKRIKPGQYWINSASSRYDEDWTYVQDEPGEDVGRRLNQGIDLFEKLTGEPYRLFQSAVNGNFSEISNAPYNVQRLLDFYNAIGRFEYNTSIKVIVNENSTIFLKSQMYVHDYFNFDIKLNELPNQFENIDLKQLGSWGLRFVQSTIPEILVNLGMANNYEQWGVSSIKITEFKV